MNDLIDHLKDDTGAHGVALERAGRLARTLVLVGFAALAIYASSCATGGRGLGVRAAVAVGAPEGQGASAPAGWASNRVRIEVQSVGPDGWRTPVGGAEVQCLGPGGSIEAMGTTGPDGSMLVDVRAYSMVLVRMPADPEGRAGPAIEAPWMPAPDETIPNAMKLVVVVGGGQ